MNDDDIQTLLALLERSHTLDPDDPRFLAIENAAAHLRKHAKRRRKVNRRRRAAEALHLEDHATAKALRAEGRHLVRPRRCYVCKTRFDEPHAQYHALCVPCGETSAGLRDAPFDLQGRRALITGGRVKIGYAIALRMLRSGAEVVVTTRFPRDAARRYAAEPDLHQWQDRLSIEGLDFRDLRAVMASIEQWRTQSLDILINNAAQTVWHPPSHYEALWSAEQQAAPLPVRDRGPAQPLLAMGTATQIDRHRTNSWVLPLEDVPPVEMVEAQVVNQIVPFLLCSRLEPALRRSTFADRYIINVAAVEGQFSRHTKPARHPHTNMAKAALNMLTRTSASAYAERGIHMVSVDPGWVSHEGPPALEASAHARGFHPPLTMEDAATRVLDPIRLGVQGMPIHGVLLKDFVSVPW